MKAILISQEKFKKTVMVTMDEYIANMKKAARDEEKNYSRIMELADALTLSIAFGLLEGKLFDKGGDCDE
jgi:hypothetical protein